MTQNYWLAQMDAAVSAAFAPDLTEDCLALFHEAGMHSVRARAFGLQASRGCES